MKSSIKTTAIFFAAFCWAGLAASAGVLNLPASALEKLSGKNDSPVAAHQNGWDVSQSHESNSVDRPGKLDAKEQDGLILEGASFAGTENHGANDKDNSLQGFQGEINELSFYCHVPVSPIPEPGACAAMFGVMGLGFALIRRQLRRA